VKSVFDRKSGSGYDDALPDRYQFPDRRPYLAAALNEVGDCVLATIAGELVESEAFEDDAFPKVVSNSSLIIGHMRPPPRAHQTGSNRFEYDILLARTD
jgi:hypothetical protein